MIKIGDKVTFFYWTDGKLESTTATVTLVHEPDDGPQALALTAHFSKEVMDREGYVPEQTHTRRRDVIEDSIHASGSWMPIP